MYDWGGGVAGGNIILSDLVATKMPVSFLNSLQGHSAQVNPLSLFIFVQSGLYDPNFTSRNCPSSCPSMLLSLKRLLFSTAPIVIERQKHNI